MPTATSNGIAIVDACVNGTSSATQRQRVLSAFSTGMPAEATTEDRAAVFVREVRQFIVNRVKHEESQATTATVDTDFRPAP